MFYVKPYSEIVSDSHINPLGMIRLIFLSCKNKEFSRANKGFFYTTSLLILFAGGSFRLTRPYFYTHTYFQIKLNMNFWHIITFEKYTINWSFCTILTNGFPFQDIRFYISPGIIKWIFLFPCLVDIIFSFLSLLPQIVMLNTTIL